MRSARLAASCLVGLLGALGLGGCQDVGVVGEQPDCEPACGPDTFCMLELLQCVECAQDDDCGSGHPFCEGFACAECRSDDDCPKLDDDEDEDDQRTCDEGTCVPSAHAFDSTDMPESDDGEEEEDDDEQDD